MKYIQELKQTYLHIVVSSEVTNELGNITFRASSSPRNQQVLQRREPFVQHWFLNCMYVAVMNYILDDNWAKWGGRDASDEAQRCQSAKY